MCSGRERERELVIRRIADYDRVEEEIPETHITILNY
jgi:hypothetical protein